MSWAIERLDLGGDGSRLAVKDLIDIQGMITTAGSRLVASRAAPAPSHAPVIVRALNSGARIVGKANLTELAYGAQGINPWFGTPKNPLAEELIPGGSSSGSAVAVAIGDADVAYGSDTGGSIRIPAACCGLIGLKTTLGVIPTTQVWPLAESLDTLGPIAAQFGYIVEAMGWLSAEFEVTERVASTVGRISTTGSGILELSISEALKLAGMDVEDVEDPGLSQAWRYGSDVMGYEALRNNFRLLKETHRLDPRVSARLKVASGVGESQYLTALKWGEQWRAKLEVLLRRYGLLALPTIPFPIPTLEKAYDHWLNVNTLPFNLAGLPAISFPLSVQGCSKVLGYGPSSRDPGQGIGANHMPIPTSLQLVGPAGSEATLIATAKRITEAIESVI